MWWPHQIASPGDGGRALPRIHIPTHSALSTRSKRIHDITFGHGMAAGVARKLSILTANGILGSAPGFLSGYTFIAFSTFQYDYNAAEVWNVVIPTSRETNFLDSRAPSTQSNMLWGASGAGLRCQGLFEMHAIEIFCRQWELVLTLSPVYDKTFGHI